MSNPLLLDIVTYLVGKGLVTGDGVDAFRDFMPENPDDVVTLIEYKGDPAQLVDKTVVNRSVQLSVRSPNADTARQKALAIYKALDKSDLRIDFTAERWGQVHLRQPPFKLNTDSLNRVVYGFNVGILTNIE